ncbi:hypothetical protein ElyMa_002134400 [Elysia marginata]|uniref:Uncharacterized protein n=1 Tax=Elysia marginata TaxID=1093978 RepID=A0AAV4FIU0_9GAST|nr:hypothetical protein ElyMa_002134400 [Elysia marginata]
MIGYFVTEGSNTPCRPQPRPFPNHKQQLATEKQPRSRASEIYSTAERRVDQGYSEDSRSSRGVPVGALRYAKGPKSSQSSSQTVETKQLTLITTKMGPYKAFNKDCSFTDCNKFQNSIPGLAADSKMTYPDTYNTGSTTFEERDKTSSVDTKESIPSPHNVPRR